MPSLEAIVRPFQTPTTIADKAKPITTVAKSTPQKALLVWGSVGQSPDLESLNFNVTNSDRIYKEKSRKTTQVRIENPDDPNQYIITQRINSIQFGTPVLTTAASSTTAFKSSPD